MTREESLILGAAIGGVFGLLGASAGAWVTYRVAKRKRADDLFSTALEFLGRDREAFVSALSASVPT